MAEGRSDDLARRIEGLPREKRALLERRLMQRRGGGSDSIPRRAPGPCPLSFSQQRLWFLDQWAPGEPTYNAGLAMRILGSLGADHLERALAAVIERHEALRTVFRVADGVPRQVVRDDWSFELARVDLGTVPAPGREPEMHRLARETARRPFDLSTDLMLRATLFRMGRDDHVLVLVEHHVAFDGWSDAALFRELEEIYAALGGDRPAVLPELPIQYADFAVWQRDRMGGPMLAEHVDHWRRALAGAPALLALPTDRPRPPLQRFVGAHHHFSLPGGHAASIRALGQSEGATPFMTLLAAFSALLRRWSGQQDILIGTPIANRSRLEVEQLIGFFSNTLVIRTCPPPDATFRQLVRTVRDAAIGAYEHQDLPFEKLVEALRPPRDPSRNPLFQVNFRLQSAPPPSLRLPGVEITPFNLDLGFSRFDLALELQVDGDAMTGYFEYRDDLFDPGTIGRLADTFESLLGHALAWPDVPLVKLAFGNAIGSGRPLSAVGGDG